MLMCACPFVLDWFRENLSFRFTFFAVYVITEVEFYWDFGVVV